MSREEAENDQQAGKMTMLHGFKKHIISNFLKDRHPYLHSPFNQRYDPKEVFHAVFDRSIPKLVEIVNMEGLPSQSYKEAFMLLNEMASHQENKLIMIDSDLVSTSLAFMQHEDEEVRRDSTSLLGSLLSVRKGRDRLAECKIDEIFKVMLLDDGLACREMCGWMLCRMCSGRDGVEIIINHDQVEHIIASFKKFSDHYDKAEAMFIVYLLECMACILQTDEGIVKILGTAAMKRFTEILSTEDDPFGEYDTRIKYLCLHCTALISMNEEGKEESITFHMIQKANRYLLHPDNEVANAAIKVIMFSSVHLKGKEEAAPKDNHEIVINLISLLEHSNKDIIRNAEIAIENIADLPRGFKIICKYLSSHLAHLERIFEQKCIVPLYSLLFQVDKPPFMTEENQANYLRYALAIAYFINHTEYSIDALNEAIERTCRIVDRLVPLLLVKSNSEAQHQIALAIEKICDADEVNKHSFQNFVAKYGEIHNELNDTNLLNEIANYRDLFEVYKDRLDAHKDTDSEKPRSPPKNLN